MAVFSTTTRGANERCEPLVKLISLGSPSYDITKLAYGACRCNIDIKCKTNSRLDKDERKRTRR